MEQFVLAILELLPNNVREDWLQYLILIVIFVRVFQSELAGLLPSAIKNYLKMRQAKLVHKQRSETKQKDFDRLKELSRLSSVSYTEEQLTVLTAELQVMLNDAMTYIRTEVSQKIDIHQQGLSRLKAVVYDVKEIEKFILSRSDEIVERLIRMEELLNEQDVDQRSD